MTGRILAIDPGSTKSAWAIVCVQDGSIASFADEDNEQLLARLIDWEDQVDEMPRPYDLVVVECTRPRGMPASEELFETIWWAGRFTQAAWPSRVDRVQRDEVKLHLTGKRAAGDPNIRAALIDRYGGIGGKAEAIGTKAKPGPLYGVAGDVWAALAVGVTWIDTRGGIGG